MSELLNLVGLSAGVVLYAMLLAMVVRAGRRPAVPSRFDPLLLVTAVLGLGLESVRAAGLRAPEGWHRGTVSLSPDARLQRARLPPGGGRALGPSRRARRGAQRVEAVDRGRGVCGQRDCRLAASLVGVGRLAGPFGYRHASADLHVRRARRAARRPDARTAGRAPCALGGGARDLCGVRASPEPASSGRRVVAGRARRSSRVAAARLRHPVSGLSIRPGGSRFSSARSRCSPCSRSRSPRC